MGLRDLRKKQALQPWLYSIALNTCRNSRRSWWSRLFSTGLRLDQRSETDQGSMSVELEARTASPEKVLETKLLRMEIIRALNMLDLKHRELIVLRDIQGLSYEEIETITRLNMGTIKSRLARAREAMRGELKELKDEA
ncbi:MAG: sigma-70 family RNA polymerase sigma factor [bacterium]